MHSYLLHYLMIDSFVISSLYDSVVTDYNFFIFFFYFLNETEQYLSATPKLLLLLVLCVY